MKRANWPGSQARFPAACGGDLEGTFIIQEVYNPTVEAFDDPGSGEVTVSTIRLDLLESTGEDVILMIQHFTAGDADFFAALFMYNAGAVAFIRTNGKEGQKMAHMRHYTQTFKFHDELGGFLEAEAQRQNRSVNNLVETPIMDSYAYRMRFGIQ